MLTAAMKAEMEISCLVELGIYQQGGTVTISLIQRYSSSVGEWFFRMFSICLSSLVLFLITHFLSMTRDFFSFEDFTIYIPQRDTLKMSMQPVYCGTLNICVRM